MQQNHRMDEAGIDPGQPIRIFRTGEKTKPIQWIAAIILLLLWQPAMALDGLKFSIGKGNSRVDALRISGQWIWPYRWSQRGDWLFTGYWDLALNRWTNDIKVTRAVHENLTATHEIWTASFTPVFRWQRETPTAQGLMPFIDAGVGAALFSNRRLADTGLYPREFGTYLQIMSTFSAGTRFGENLRFEVSLRRYHYSNANVDRFNQGIDLWMLNYGYWF